MRKPKPMFKPKEVKKHTIFTKLVKATIPDSNDD